MAETITPRTAEEVRDSVRWALSEGKTLEIATGGSKRALGRPVMADARLSVSGLSQIAFYEPEELVLSADPGVSLAELEALVAQRGQMLPFEPPHWGPLLGAGEAAGTLGGVVGAGLSGPRRTKAGAARDFVLGVEGVSGFGEAFKAGGRVMKNVSGYDLPKLLTGSYGTLAVLTRITLKVLPAPEVETTIVLPAENLGEGVRLLNAAASGPFEPTGLAFLPDEVAASAGLPEAAAAIRVEGPAVSLDDRAAGLAALLPDVAGLRLETEASRALWQRVRDVSALLRPADGPIWRLSVPPSEAPATIAGLKPRAWYADWAGGLLWVQMDGERLPEAGAGSAMLVAAPEALRATAPVFPALDPARAALSARIKKSFDPNGILNPGRMREGV